MEGKGLKSVIMCALVLGLVVEHIQAERKFNFYCPLGKESTCYAKCLASHGRSADCALYCGCYKVSCPSEEKSNCYAGCQASDRYPDQDCVKYCSCKIGFSLAPNAGAAIVSDYCKLGCASSVCDAISTDVGNKKQKDAVERCNNACSRLCTKDVEIAMVNA